MIVPLKASHNTAPFLNVLIKVQAMLGYIDEMSFWAHSSETLFSHGENKPIEYKDSDFSGISN